MTIGQHLTLCACPGLEVRLDGPAIQVSRTGERPRWFPLSRLGVVTFVGHITLDTRLLRELGSRGIALRFMAHGERVDTVAVGVRQGAPLGLPGDLDAFHDSLDWREVYVRWRSRQDLWAAGRALRRFHHLSDLAGLCSPGRAARRLFGNEAIGLLAALEGHLHADAMELALQQGWPGDRLRSPRPGVDAVRDMVRAMKWEILRLLHRFSDTSQPARWYAQHRHVLLARARLCLESLIRVVRQSTRSII